MKRHPQLHPLSRQHHNGLLASLLLKKGLAKNADGQVMSDFIQNFWQQDLKEHFENEEQFLLPALTNSTFDQKLSERLLDEHKILRNYIHQLQNNFSDKRMIEVFANLLEQHIRFEERIYFPEAEKVLTEEQLEEIGKHLNDDENKNCINYPVKFWE
jgi:hemerythrin-like domain-containing protein